MISSPTLISILDELDKAIAENMVGLTAGQVEEESEESSIFELRGMLQQQFNQQGDINMDQISFPWDRGPIPLPGWLPRSLTDAMGMTGTSTASQALSRAIAKPQSTDIRSLSSAVERALSQHSGSKNNSRAASEHAGPSGLTTADRRGTLDRPSGPSSTTTVLIDQPVSQMNSRVSPTDQTQHFNIGTASRAASVSSRAAERARLEYELAKAKEERITAELAALDAGSSRASEAGSLQDRLSLAGLSRGTVSHAPAALGVAHSSKPSDGNVENASQSMQDNARHDQPAASQPPQSSSPLPSRPESLPPAGTPPTFGLASYVDSP